MTKTRADDENTPFRVGYRLLAATAINAPATQRCADLSVAYVLVLRRVPGEDEREADAGGEDDEADQQEPVQDERQLLPLLADGLPPVLVRQAHLVLLDGLVDLLQHAQELTLRAVASPAPAADGCGHGGELAGEARGEAAVFRQLVGLVASVVVVLRHRLLERTETGQTTVNRSEVSLKELV